MNKCSVNSLLTGDVDKNFGHLVADFIALFESVQSVEIQLAKQFEQGQNFQYNIQMLLFDELRKLQLT